MKRSKRLPADASAIAVKALLDAATPPPACPAHVRLRQQDLPFWAAVLRSRSRDEWVAKLGVVAEEADETVHWLEFTMASKLADEERVEPLLAEAIELRAIFAASYATSRRNRGKRNRSTDQQITR